MIRAIARRQVALLSRALDSKEGLHFAGISLISGRDALRLWLPYASGSYSMRARVAISALSHIWDSLEQALEQFSVGQANLHSSSESFANYIAANYDAARLGNLFTSNGSDKATTHDYQFIYAAILERTSVGRLLEIGIGSPSRAIPSNMGSLAKPGASLRAFRDFLPSAQIVGADVDKGSFVSEQRISCVFLDQLDDAAWHNLAVEFSDRTFDLIIDDGLHSIDANIRTIRESGRLLRPGGWVVIEDIDPSLAPFWRTVGRVLSITNEVHLIVAKGALVFAFRKGKAA